MNSQDHAAHRARIERICAARFPMWDTMAERTKEQYRRQAEFWTGAVDAVAAADQISDGKSVE